MPNQAAAFFFFVFCWWVCCILIFLAGVVSETGRQAWDFSTTLYSSPQNFVLWLSLSVYLPCLRMCVGVLSGYQRWHKSFIYQPQLVPWSLGYSSPNEYAQSC